MSVFGPAASGGGGMTALVVTIIIGSVVLWLLLMPSFRSKAAEHLDEVATYVRPERKAPASVEEATQPAPTAAAIEPGEVAAQLGFDMSEFTARFGAGETPALPAASTPPELTK